MGDQAMAYAPQPDEPEVIVANAGARGGGGNHDHVQRRFLQAGPILVTGGCLVLTNTTIGSRAANAEHALVGLALLLLGVFLTMLSLVSNRLPRTARVGAAVADAVLFYLFPPAGN